MAEVYHFYPFASYFLEWGGGPGNKSIFCTFVKIIKKIMTPNSSEPSMYTKEVKAGPIS